MSYTVLARRYRSQTFDEVVGQEAIARTLQNAIALDRVAHAYLFVGTRGVGKTTMARLLAKALNAGSGEVEQAVMAGQDTDVIEIDAASNRGVDEARDLIANCIYRPMRGAYKIYIIDEVHMLTREAFNALLKTMEEPPSHVKFILCTTEPHKVPPTIQSRCQRFDFRNISTDQIAAHLASVIDQEKMQADAELVRAVASMAAGSMRDGLSLLDRVMAAAGAGEPMTADLLEKLLGLPERDGLLGLVETLAQSDARSALERADELLTTGVSIDQMMDSLVAFLRDLMVLSACGPETDLVDLVGESRDKSIDLAGRFSTAGLVHMIGLCESVGRMSKSSANPRALFDALIVRLAMTEQIADVAALLKNAGADSPQTPSPRRAASTVQKKSAKPALTTPAAQTPAPSAPSPSSSSSPSPERGVNDVWARVQKIAGAKTMTRVLVQSLTPVRIEADAVVLTADDPNLLSHARSKKELIETLFKEAAGRPMRIEFDDGEAPEPAATGNLASDPVLKNDVVRKAISLFEAKVVSIEPDESA